MHNSVEASSSKKASYVDSKEPNHDGKALRSDEDDLKGNAATPRGNGKAINREG